MKVHIGPYTNWIGPYQIAEKILFWMDKYEDDRVHEFGNWLAGENNDSLLSKLCEWVESKKKRTIKVHIDKYDTWNMDDTLAHIILPMLIQLKKDTHGAPYVDDDDVPEELKSTAAPKKEDVWDTDENHFKRWDWVIDEMIWAFTHKTQDNDAKFCSGKSDIVWVSSDKVDEKGNPLTYEMQKGPNDTFKIDMDGLKNHHKRMSNGFRLFGKYYEGLWD